VKTAETYQSAEFGSGHGCPVIVHGKIDPTDDVPGEASDKDLVIRPARQRFQCAFGWALTDMG
jgi:hypothetical protein